ncbi:transcriptional regulator [Georgenia sp. TF02-10]|uniref:sugar-binding transcriptional regulator n=1 Tax=Georgenia sp. TF02-10 TaxID=2917725 RepID=UPI001FA7E68E|nr:sugar-binding domain-containing protein [Georgenia sp. TF02-10]UNX54475.1 transcriptional regulator [Georgenia sp. TF02-10]
MTGREDAVYQAASMYYLQDETMEVIARRMGTSRSTVSRMLKDARDSGLVRVTLTGAGNGVSPLARQLGQRFGVRAHVVPVRGGITEVQRLDQVARVAGRLISEWVQPGSVLGLAWGTTLSAVVGHLVPKHAPGSEVVQLNGAANPVTSGIPHAGSIITAAAQNFDAAVHHFPVPAFFDYAATKRAMWRERSIQRVLAVQARADVVAFGVGAFDGALASHVYAAGYMSQGDMDQLRLEGVVGDVCTVLLREDGSYADIELNERATGPTPAELARVARRVCVVAGAAKVPPLLGALRARAVTDLVIDEATARAALDRAHARGAGAAGSARER